MFEQYPYSFRLEIAYSLAENEIRISYRIINKGREDMPFLMGGHPGFNCPLFPEERYDDYYLEFEKKETCDVPTPVTETGLIDVSHRNPFLKEQDKLLLSHALFEKDAVILDKLQSRTVKLLSKNHEPFIALEPWLGLSTCSDESDVFEEKRNIQFVTGGMDKEYSFRICVMDERE